MRMMMPNPVKPPPVMFPRSLWVNPNCVPQSPRIPPRMENPTPAAKMAMKPAHKSRYAWGATPLLFPLLIGFVSEVFVSAQELKRKRRQLDNRAALQRRLVRAKTDTGPVGRLLRIRERVAIFHQRHDEFVNEMGM